MMNFSNKKPVVLISPLDWGMGHATRIVPVVEQFINQGFNVIIAASGKGYSFLKKYFPNIPVLKAPSLNILYSKKAIFFEIKLLLQSYKIVNLLIKNYLFVKKLVKKYKIDLIVSDNNFGFRHKKIFSVYITHQINLNYHTNSLSGRLADLIHKKIFSRYDEIWVPDFNANNKVAGKLSDTSSLKNSYYIGILSRLKNFTKCKEKYNLTVLLSGVEPQRTILERKILKQLKETKLTVAVIAGRPEAEYFSAIENISIFSHINDKKFSCILKNSQIIIARAGYSTIMDLLKMGLTAILIPTPNQTEQEYLAEFLQQKGYFLSFNQKDFDLRKAVDLFLQKKEYLQKNIRNLTESIKENLLERKILALKNKFYASD